MSLLLFKNQEEETYQWLSFFIRKFEVTKKIWNSYTVSFKPATSSSYNILLNYATLALNLLTYFEKFSNYKMINCAFKLNDLLTSKINDLKTFQEIFISLISLCLEMKIFNTLLKEKSIKI